MTIRAKLLLASCMPLTLVVVVANEVKVGLVRLDEQGEPVGLAVFDPGFPGAFPFRVARPALAGALLAALAPYARPDQPTMQVVVEDDSELLDLLIAAGARVRLQFLHYRGALADTR